jgi:hypothetical protein
MGGMLAPQLQLLVVPASLHLSGALWYPGVVGGGPVQSTPLGADCMEGGGACGVRVVWVYEGCMMWDPGGSVRSVPHGSVLPTWQEVWSVC